MSVELGTEFHGGAAQMLALLLDVGQSKSAQNVARANAALTPHLKPYDKHASDQRQLQQKRAHIDRSATSATLDWP